MRFLNLSKLSFTFSCLLYTILFNGCQKENAFDCVKSTGKIVTETRALPEFHAIKVFDNVDVVLVPDTLFFAEIICGEHLQENVTTEVKNNELWVQNINKCNWVRSYEKPMEVRIHCPEISTILHDGFGTIFSEGELKTDHLILHVTGAGDLDLEVKTESIWLDMYELGNIKLRGSNNSLNAFVMSSGSLETPSLTNREVTIKIAGDGSANLFASRLVSATITGRGNVFYSGTPSDVNRTGDGIGQLIKVE